jgi:hypothetical protein
VIGSMAGKSIDLRALIVNSIRGGCNAADSKHRGEVHRWTLAIS